MTENQRDIRFTMEEAIAAAYAPTAKLEIQPKPPTLPEIVTVHEKTVQKAARGELKQPRKKRKARTPKPEVVFDRNVKVDPMVWAAAQELVGGPNAYTRIEIRNNHEVVVR